jgi:polyphosphate kinase
MSKLVEHQEMLRNENAISNYDTTELIHQSSKGFPLLERDISWLSFNYRVLSGSQRPHSAAV